MTNPIVSKPTASDPLNSTGQEIVRTINDIVSFTNADADPYEQPPINPDVNTYASMEEGKAYVFGDEIRSSIGYFRCVKDIPQGETKPLFDHNYWRLFWATKENEGFFYGVYNTAKEYPIGVVVIADGVNEIKLLRTKVMLTANTPFAIANFELLGTIPK
ncbi:hypothetical protein SM033_00036 [Vibrio phage vB_VpaM_sm033]|nr:hypothetical protein SM033_00036 [Vibrio phage vB_VpaM_sm033]